MLSLPIDAYLHEIVSLTRQHRRLVLVAPPGSGKTTRVAPALIKHGQFARSHPALVMLQPRRVAARASARRIAEENEWTLGDEVGYHIRNEKRLGPRTRLRVATEGILTRQLLDDPFLEGVGAVILDEFHERGLHTDLALALVREAADSVRDDLILIVMSATLDAEPVASYLGGCPIVRVEGRSYPVDVEYVASGEKSPLPARVASAVARVIEAGATGDRGDILVFLPGLEEIRRSGRALASLADRENLLVLPLHGSLSSEEQDRALRPSNRRKVVLSTNVAETSLTIEGVTTVIDSGLARFARHDPARGLDRLELGWISRASATQRAGRAGRTAPGRCLRLWPEREDRGRAEFDEPEIRRVDLSATVLAIKSWGHTDPREFDWFESPSDEALTAAETLLCRLSALDEAGSLTPIGRQLLALPVHPRLGRLLCGAASCGRLDDGAALAALLSEKDILAPSDHRAARRESSRGDSDLLVRLDQFQNARDQRFSSRLRDTGIDPNAARRVEDVRAELLRIGRRLPSPHYDEGSDETLLQLALLAYPDRVCRRRASDPMTGTMVSGRGVRLDPESVVRDAEFFLAIDPRDVKRSNKREAVVRIASAIDPRWLDDAFPGSVHRERIVRFDEARGRPVAFDTLFYLDLPLRDDTHGAVTESEASSALAEWLAPQAREFIREHAPASSWLDRYDFLRAAMPEADLPDLDDAALAQVLASACEGKRTLGEVGRVPFIPLLKGRLSFSQSRFVEAEAPESITVPTGNAIRLVYEPGRAPVMAVRLQELFGLADTPRVAGGRVPVLIHLLGPNYRPVQITDDLRSFWTTTYFQVRKDLRNRYPKHSWPEDPWNARPEAKGSRRHSP